MNDLIIDQTNLMRKIRNSYESFGTLGDGATSGVLESRLATFENHWEKVEANSTEMLSIKEPIDYAREYFVKNLYDLAEGAFIEIRDQY